MPQRASVFCNFYIRVDREALVSERALNVGSVAFKAMSTKNYFNQSVSYGWGKSQQRRQGSKAKDQHGRGLDNLQKQVRRFYIYQKLKMPHF
jgi:hypothetical protein